MDIILNYPDIEITISPTDKSKQPSMDMINCRMIEITLQDTSQEKEVKVGLLNLYLPINY